MEQLPYSTLVPGEVAHSQQHHDACHYDGGRSLYFGNLMVVYIKIILLALHNSLNFSSWEFGVSLWMHSYLLIVLCCVKIMDTRMGFSCPFHSVVIDSISPFPGIFGTIMSTVGE